MTRRSDLGAARAPNTLGLLKNHEADWMLQRTLAYMNVNAAEIGEVRTIAQRIDERDPDSWPTAWSDMAAIVEAHGQKALADGDLVSARQALLRASNYFRAAEYGCVPSHPRFHELWERSVTAFRNAAVLHDPPIEPIEVPFDDTIEEDVLIIGPAAVARGYSVFTFSYPGHRNAVHTDASQVKRPDYEVPFAAALDVLQTLPGVDERIALMGFSGGGYVAPRVAMHDERIVAVIANNPMIDYARVAAALLGPMVRRVPKRLLEWTIGRKLTRDPLMRAYMEYGLWTAGYPETSLYGWLTDPEAQAHWARFTIADDLHRITCPALSLVGAGEGEEMLTQTREYHQGIASTRKQMHVFTLEEDGSYDHCMLDNHSRMQQVTFAWLDDVLATTTV
jgi:pimeloyl-ACP methyl ester carboxylesterase